MIQEKHFNYYFTKKREFESQKTPVQKLFHFISVAVRLSQVFKLQPPERTLSQSKLGSQSAGQSEKTLKEPYGNRKFRRIIPEQEKQDGNEIIWR